MFWAHIVKVLDKFLAKDGMGMLASLLETQAGYSGWLASAINEDGEAVYLELGLEPAMEVQLLEITHNEWHIHITNKNEVFFHIVNEDQASHIRLRACQHCWACGACHISP